MTATALFTSVYFPQIVLNRRRQSTRGFSTASMVVKLIGGAFLWTNAAMQGETAAVVAYGAFGFACYSVLLVQIALYSRRPAVAAWSPGLLALAVTLALWAPGTVALTNAIKPATQIMSHGFQLLEFHRVRTAAGMSLTSQHLNLIGGALGVVMCILRPPKSTMTLFLYTNSLVQAVTVYMAVVWLHGWAYFARASALTAWLVGPDAAGKAAKVGAGGDTSGESDRKL
jgi:hypothetical protein